MKSCKAFCLRDCTESRVKKKKKVGCPTTRLRRGDEIHLRPQLLRQVFSRRHKLLGDARHAIGTRADGVHLQSRNAGSSAANAAGVATRAAPAIASEKARDLRREVERGKGAGFA